MGKVIAFGSNTKWDERRNTSRVQPIAPNALAEVERALATFRREHPQHVRWIEAGYPTLTSDEHIAWFGAPW